MIDLPLGKAIIAKKKTFCDGCKGCYFNEFQNLCNEFNCGRYDREDSKNIIFKLVDYPEAKK